MTLLCIPARLYLLPRFFEGWELVLLDGEDEKIEEWVAAKEASMGVDDMEGGKSRKAHSSSIRTHEYSDSGSDAGKHIEEEA